MVFVSRATPINHTPLLVALSTERASTSVETAGCFYSFHVPGDTLTFLSAQGVPDPYLPPIFIVLEMDDGDRCHHHDHNRWYGRRVSKILIVDSPYSMNREDDFW